MLERYVKKILSAPVYDVAIESHLDAAPLLSQRLDNQVWLKREDMQPVFSFKLRGAYNKMVQLSEEQRQRGVITASAGNHAQGVALAASRLGIKATIVMSVNTASIKVNAVKARGVRVVLQGDTYDDASSYAHALAQEHGYEFVHPYDDEDVIAGQGTIAAEILRQHAGNIDAIFVPVGGGGLIAGIAAYCKYVRPDLRVIGVEAEGSACLSAALKAKRRVRLPNESLDLFADGVSVAQVGEEPFRIARAYVDDVITADTDEICAAVKDVFEDTRTLLEPAGALAVAGMKTYVAREGWRRKTLIAIASGANVNFDRLRHISERAELGEQKEALFAVTIPEQPGSFRRFCRDLGKRNVTEFNYRFANGDHAQVFVGLSVSPNSEDHRQLAQHLRDLGYEVEDLTTNEMAKVHVRHMVGGRAELEHETIYRFEFPERPGALMRFLNLLGERWNISMFHYRNHGAAFGRVLAGFDVTPKARQAFIKNLNEIGYRYWPESDNPAYWRFLR